MCAEGGAASQEGEAGDREDTGTSRRDPPGWHQSLRRVPSLRLCERFFREMYQNRSGFKISFHPPPTPRPREGKAVGSDGAECRTADVRMSPTLSKHAIVCVFWSRKP